MIIIKSSKEIELMREGGKILAEVMECLGEAVFPGNNTFEINKLAKELILKAKGVPIFEGYGDKKNPYPAAVCISVNNEIVHGIPRKEKILQIGDIVKLDIGILYKGMITDMARTYPVGKISNEAQKLIETTKEALNAGIKIIKAGMKLNDYGRVVEKYAKSNGFSVVYDLVGHGVGKKLHEDPFIPNYPVKLVESVFRENMTVALEPMINVGTRYIKLMPDGWTYATKDGKLSAHFEDTIVVKKNGVEILTRI